MNLEDRLREAMRAEASGVEPDDITSLTTIGARARAARHRRRRVLAGAMTVLLVVAGLVIIPRLGASKQFVKVTNQPAGPKPRPTTTTTGPPKRATTSALPETTTSTTTTTTTTTTGRPTVTPTRPPTITTTRPVTPTTTTQPTPTTSTTTQPTTTATTTTTTPTTSTTTTTPTTTTTTGGGPQFVCPKGGLVEVLKVQEAVDQGHQPWRLSPEEVAAECTFGRVPTTLVEPMGTNRYKVTDGSTGNAVIVTVTQPVRSGPGGIWAVTSVAPAS